MVTTEVAVFTLHPGLTPSGLAISELHQRGLKTVRSQPGCLKALWGVGIEEEHKMFWFVEWDKYESHQAFKDRKEIYDPFVTELMSLTDPSADKGIIMHHYDFPTSVSELVTSSSPVVELFSFTIKSTVGHEKFLDTLDGFGKVAEKHGGHPTGASSREDEKKALAPITWASVEEHGKFRETDDFKNAIGAVRDIMEGPSVIHVELKE